jgi:hypothetical protein
MKERSVMSHVDEGRLTTYLDGMAQVGSEKPATAELEEHLASCAECQAKLDQLRVERERARGILRGTGAPLGTTPSFADVVERSRRRTNEKSERRQLSRLTSLAWAASVILAVATGWYIRQATFQATDQSSLQDTRSTVPPVAPPAPGGRFAAPAREEAPMAKSSRDENRPTRTSPLPSGPTPKAVAPSRAMGQIAVAEPKKAEPAVSAAADAAIPGRFALSTESGWNEVSPDAARRQLGGHPLVIAGAAVTSYATSAAGDQTVRITQQLGDGTVLELIERPATAVLDASQAKPTRRGNLSPAGPPALAAREADAREAPSKPTDDDNRLTVTAGGYWITLRPVVTLHAALSRDSLRRLAEELSEEEAGKRPE